MNRLEASVDADGWVIAGPFRERLPDGIHIPARQSLVAGVRPEDLVLEQRGKGVPVQIDKDIDLGHYRRVSVSIDGTDLLLFVPKAERMPADAPTVSPRRMLLYADGRLLGVTEPGPAAELRAWS